LFAQENSKTHSNDFLEIINAKDIALLRNKRIPKMKGKHTSFSTKQVKRESIKSEMSKRERNQHLRSEVVSKLRVGTNSMIGWNETV
jgi:hypothetical protein